jgi:riboflavin synthase
VVRAAFAEGPPSLGESIAVDGACLTVARLAPGGFEADLSAETLDRTTAGTWRRGRKVNLERALGAGDRFGGHLVQGHVDGVGKILSFKEGAGQWTLRVEAPASLRPLIAEKGSIAVDGVSLTVSALGRSWFEAAIIPHTLRETNLARRRAGDPVNLEADLLARYLARLLEARGPAGRR